MAAESPHHSRRSLLAGAGVLTAGGVLARPQAAGAATTAAATAAGTAPDWIDITAAPYSADPTGAGDSTAGIQAALNQAAANGGGVIYVPTGNFKVTSGLTYDSSTGLMITGDGPQASNIRLASTAASVRYLTITQTGAFVNGNLGQQGTVIIENIAFYNDEPSASYADTHAVMVLNRVNFGSIRNIAIYEGTGPQWVNQGIILNECNQVDVDNANLFTAVNGVVVSGYSQVNNLSNTSIWMKTTGQPNAAAVLYLGQVLTANMVSVICHDGDRGVYFTQDSKGNVPHLLFAYNVQPNNHTVAAMEIDYGAQVYLTECFFSASTGIVDQPIPGVLFGPEYQGSATVASSQFNSVAGHTISIQGGKGFFITGCEIGGQSKTYKYAADSYDEINIGASVSEVTIDACHFDVDGLASLGGANPPRSAVYAAAGATRITVSNSKGAGTAYASGGIIDNGNAVMRSGNIGLGLADQTTGGGSTVTGTTAADLSAPVTVPAYDMTVGTVYRLTAFGHGKGTGLPLIGVGVDVGGTSLGTFTAACVRAGGAAAFYWAYTCYLRVTATGTSGTLVGNESFTCAGQSATHGNDSFTVDTTKANAVVMTAAWQPASGSPSITCDGTTLERVQNYPAS